MTLIEKGFFKRNRRIIIIAITIFLLSAIAGAIVGDMRRRVQKCHQQHNNGPEESEYKHKYR